MKNLAQAVPLPGVGNARELGGYPAGGGRIRRGVLLRTASLYGAPPETLRRLEVDYHLQTVVDFRMAMEIDARPDPAIPGAENLALPVLGFDEASRPGSDILERMRDPNVDRVALFDEMYENGMIQERLYVYFLTTQRGIAAYRAFFQALLALEPGRAILWHCSEGKDRTGCGAMLLLFALGASRETVMADYLLTNVYNAPMLQAFRQKAEPHHLPPEKLERMLFLTGGVSACFMENGIDALVEGYGSVENYLARELNVGEAECRALRDKFLVS